MVLWPIYTSATRAELFLYVLPMHFSINATFTMTIDEPRGTLFFEAAEEVDEKGPLCGHAEMQRGLC